VLRLLNILIVLILKPHNKDVQIKQGQTVVKGSSVNNGVKLHTIGVCRFIYYHTKSFKFPKSYVIEA
jgi:hypothetical protein